MPVRTLRKTTIKESPDEKENEYGTLAVFLLVPFSIILLIIFYNVQQMKQRFESDLNQCESRVDATLLKIGEQSEENMRIINSINSMHQPKITKTGREVLGYADWSV